MLAVQGPQARASLAPVFPEAARVGRFRVERLAWQGVACIVAGTGYTGEAGVEIAVPARGGAGALGRPGRMPASRPLVSAPATPFASRPGCPLHGHELGPGITPLQAGLGWVVAWDKPEFRGS